MDQKTRRRRDRSRSRSRSRSPYRKTHSKSYHHRSTNNYHKNNTNYNKTEMSNRLHEIKNLRQQLSKPPPSYNRHYHHQKLSEQQYLDRLEKRKNMKITISVWMQSPERDTI
eukprot:99641_1